MVQTRSRNCTIKLLKVASVESPGALLVHSESHLRLDGAMHYDDNCSSETSHKAQPWNFDLLVPP